MNFLYIIFLAAIGGTMIGLFFYKKQKARLDYFYDLVGLINSIISDVRFKQDKLVSVMTTYKNNIKSQLRSHIDEYIYSQQSLSTANISSSQSSTTYSSQSSIKLSLQCLKKTELERVQRFFWSLGRTDADTQILELDGYKNEFEQDRIKTKAHSDRYGTLYLKLGFALGVGVGIMFV